MKHFIEPLERPDTDRWALPLVVHLPRGHQHTHQDVIAAVVEATLSLTDKPYTLAEWEQPIESWLAGPFRKLTFRARASRWNAVLSLPGQVSSTRGVQVFASIPYPAADLPPQLARLQLSNLELPRTDDPASLQVPTVVLNPLFPMSTGKSAAQAAHAAQLLRDSLPANTLALWRDVVWRVCLPPITSSGFASLQNLPHTCQIRDAGFTEVPPNTVTALAVPPRIWDTM